MTEAMTPEERQLALMAERLTIVAEQRGKMAVKVEIMAHLTAAMPPLIEKMKLYNHSAAVISDARGYLRCASEIKTILDKVEADVDVALKKARE